MAMVMALSVTVSVIVAAAAGIGRRLMRVPMGVTVVGVMMIVALRVMMVTGL